MEGTVLGVLWNCDFSLRRLSRLSPLWMRRAPMGSRIRKLCRGNSHSVNICPSYLHEAHLRLFQS